ncbi:MAG: AmmeMemoRadiSam system radical SAM enzyme [Armatimonadota bacterium]|nr:AmmeMemoRadiSam system radical SAM enzyme [Armatimonadota bacterium]
MSPVTGTALDLAAVLDARTTEGTLYERLDDDKVRCLACGHRCVIFPGRRGICQVRFNEGGRLRVPWGYVAALQCDPTEKKPFFHLLPGSKTLTFGMLGCDLHCPYCQNWLTSQALRDPVAGILPDDVSPEQLVALARRHGARLLGSSYNEPLITTEWAVCVFRMAREAGLRTCFISNGNATREVLTFLRPWCDGYKIDLKTMNQKGYRQLGGVLDRVLDTIKMVFGLGFWMEIVTLVIPGWNDSEEELGAAAEFIASVSPDIPWHVTAFHPDYKMQDYDSTSAATLVRAARLGQAAGLRYVYAGNLPGRVGEFESTFCPNCRALLVERRGYHILQNHLSATAGRCPRCGFQIPGIWA